MIRKALNGKKAWEGLRKALPTFHLRCHGVRIETSTMAGVPDVNLCVNGKEVWIELKYLEDEPTDIQALWHEKRRNAGGRVVVLTFRAGSVKIWGNDGGVILSYPLTWDRILDEIWMMVR